MSAAADASDDFGEHSKDREDWDELSTDEQADVLVDAMQDRDDASDEAPDWDDVDDATQADTLAAIEQSLEETWMAEAFAFADEEPTIPFEMHRLTEEQQDTLTERAQLLDEVDRIGQQDGIEDADDIREELDDDAAELFDDLDELDAWLNTFLDDITTGDAFTAEWWSSGDNFPSGLRMEVFYETFDRYADRMEGAQSFRQEQRGARSR